MAHVIEGKSNFGRTESTRRNDHAFKNTYARLPNATQHEFPDSQLRRGTAEKFAAMTGRCLATPLVLPTRSRARASTMLCVQRNYLQRHMRMERLYHTKSAGAKTSAPSCDALHKCDPAFTATSWARLLLKG